MSVWWLPLDKTDGSCHVAPPMSGWEGAFDARKRLELVQLLLFDDRLDRQTWQLA